MTDKRYRKKPVEVDAYHFTFVGGESWSDGGMLAREPMWMRVAANNGLIWYQGGDNPHYTIKTLEGEMRASLGDYIIRGIAGEIYPCKPDIFEKIYEEVT